MRFTVRYGIVWLTLALGSDPAREQRRIGAVTASTSLLFLDARARVSKDARGYNCPSGKPGIRGEG